MKRIGLVFLSIISLIIVAIEFLFALDKYYAAKIQGQYYDKISRELIVQKNQGLKLQQEALKRENIINIYGSSELGTNTIEYHPSNFLKKNYRGFTPNLIGIGYCQSLIHAINFSALGDQLEGKKIVVIISPQWFSKDGLTADQFNMNFSELQLYSLMNTNMDDKTKNYLLGRIENFTGKYSRYRNVYDYTNLYLSKDKYSKLVLGILKPYYAFKYYALEVRDSVKTCKIIEKYKKYPESKKQVKDIEWKSEIAKANSIGEKNTNNNDFYIMNKYYDSYVKDKIKQYKDYYKGNSYAESPEYDDFKALLHICKDKNIKPLFISVPVNGKWYDYTGFSKEEREIYYSNIRNIIKPYGYSLADFSTYEYEPYFLQDTMHLGWKGWLYVNKAVDEYYNKR